MTNTEQILSSPSSCFNLFLTMALLAEQSQETVMISWTNSILQKHEQKKPGQNEQPMTGSMQEETKKKWFCLSTERFNYWNSLIRCHPHETSCFRTSREIPRPREVHRAIERGRSDNKIGFSARHWSNPLREHDLELFGDQDSRELCDGDKCNECFVQ